MDLSKPFDILDHQILLHKLKYYGVNDIPLKCSTSYLTGRQQYVEIDGYSSGLLTLTTGVPQGSILGQLLFLIYMNDIPQAPTTLTLFHMQMTQVFIVRFKHRLHPL